jgi:hypothetical protein
MAPGTKLRGGDWQALKFPQFFVGESATDMERLDALRAIDKAA